MNYAGKFDATIPSDGQGSASHFNVHLDSVHGHAPADAIIVPDAHFLFNADFKRSGLDLVLSRDDHELVLHDYFKGEKRAGLASPDGAHLTGDIVNALTGAVEVSQAGAAATGGDVIGHVTKLVGSATVIRNGVSIILNMGDNVEKGDVVQCGSDSTLGLTFIDGTVFGLSANARMVLNEMVYDPNGSNNSSLLSLVAGTITFVAGETAKHGDMKVDTPVATMGIRGTAVLVEIDFTVPGQNATPDAHFQVLVEPDGHTGSYILFDKTTLQPIAEVNQAGQQINITNGVVTQTNAPLSPDIQKLIQDVFTLKFSANDTNPKTTTAQTNTLNPELFVGPTIKLASGATATPVFEILGSNPAADPPKTSGPGNFINHIPGPPTVAVLDPHAQPTTNFALTELIGKTGDGADSDSISGRVNFVDVNAGDLPTVKIDFNSFTYQNAQHQDVTASLNALQLADVAATELKITVVPDSGNQNTGGANFSYGIADSAFDFLAAGERLTLTYNVRVDNNYAPNDESTVVPITITVTGTNDAPVITTDAQKIAFSGGTSQPGGVLTSTDPTKGMLTFTDVDLTDTHTVDAKLTDAVLSNGSTVPPGPLALFEKALTASIELDSTNTGTGTVDWQLAALPVYVADFIPKGQTLTLTYTVTVTDSQGATSDQAVTVTLTGSDNPAVVWIDTASGGTPGGSWSDAANWETGTVPTANDDVIIITDQLIGLKPSYPVTIDAKASAVAKSLTMDDYSDFAGSQPVLDVLAGGSLTIAGALSLSADSLVHDDGTIIARSLTMTNGTDAASDTPQSPELDVLSTGTLGIGSDGLTLDGNAVLNNQGTVTVAGAADFVDASVLMNDGMLTLRQGGEFAGSSSITNGPSGTIDVAGGTMTASVDIANHGRIIVDGGAVLDLDSRTIDGGTVSIRGASEESGSPGTLELYGGVLQNGMLNNSGLIAVIGSDSALHDETVVNNGTLEVIWGDLTIDQGSTFSNFGTIQLDSLHGAELAVKDSAIDGGAILNESRLNLVGGAVLKNGALENLLTVTAYGLGNSLEHQAVTGGGIIAVEQGAELTIDKGSTVSDPDLHIYAGTLILNDATFDGGGTVTNETGGIIDLTGLATIKSGSLTNWGQIAVSGTGNSLDGETVVNASGTISITGVLKLDLGTIIAGGTVVNSGTLSVETSTGATLDGVNVDNTDGTILVDGESSPQATLVLDDGTTITGGMLTVGGVGTLELSTHAGAILSSVTVNNYNIVQVDACSVLTLDRAAITGGTVTDDGMIHVIGDTAIDNADISGGQINVDADVTLTLDNTTVTGTSISGSINVDAEASLTLDDASLTGVLTNAGAVTVDADYALVLNDGTIDGGSLTNNGTINSTGTSAIDNADISNHGVIAAISGTLVIDPGTLTNTGTLQADGGELDISGEQIGNTGTLAAIDGGTLKLVSSTVDNTGGGTVTVGADSILDLDHTDIWGGTLTISGTLHNLAGSNTITAAVIENGGHIEVDGGALDLAGALAGGIQITGASTLELGANNPNAYSQATVTFESESTGALIIDHAASFGGIVAGFDDNKLDLADISYASNPTVSYANGMLSVVVDGADVANIRLDGDYSGVHWILGDDGSSQHGTTIMEAPGTIAGLDSNGNAAEGTSLAASVTDGGQAVTGVSYDWQVSSDGVHWTDAAGANGASIYTPVEADDGEALRVSLSFTDGAGKLETSTVSAGTVQASTINNLTVQLDSTSAQEDATVHVTAVTEGGAAISNVSYDWQVSSDGIEWRDAAGANGTSSYTPVGADEGLQLRLLTTLVSDSPNPQSTTNDLGVVGESASEPAQISLSGLSEGDAVQGQQITATVTDADAPVSGVTYSFQTSSDGIDWITVQSGSGNTYVPTENDEGSQLRVSVSFTDTHGFVETGTATAGTVQDANDLVTTLNATTAAQGAQITVIGVTDSGAPVASGLSYCWEVSSDGTNWAQVDTHSYYAPTEQDEGKSLRLVTDYVDQATGHTEQTINMLGTVADIAPTLIAPFTFAVDELRIVKNDHAVFDDTFGQAPPAGGTFGNSAVSFITQGSTWTDVGGKAIMSSTGAVALPTVDAAQVIARLGTNTQGESVSNGGLKEDATFKVSATFDLVVPQYNGQRYGIDLNDSSATHANDEMVQLVVVGDGQGGATIKLVQADFATATFTTIASQALTAGQLAGNNQIELDLAHLTANSSAITGSFELLNNGSQTSSQTFETTGHVFNTTTYTRADIFASGPTAIVITGEARDGQTLTANTTTNDSDATINYQWQHSSDGKTWTDIGDNSATYLVQVSDEGLQIRVVAGTADPDSSQAPATAVSAPTATVQPPTVTIAVETPNGMDFVHQDVPAQMGAGTVNPGGSSSFTVVDSADHIQFVVSGSNFSYDGHTVTGGTITSFEEFTTDSAPVALANFTGIAVDATTWMADVHAGTGDITIGQNGVAEFASNVAADQTVSFTDLSGKLMIDNPAVFDAHIGGISGSGDVLDLGGFDAAHDVIHASTGSGSYDAATNTTLLTVTDATNGHSVGLTLVGDYSAASWAVTSDPSNGGADITWSHQAPVIETDKFTVAQNDDGTTTITGLQVNDSDPSAASESFTLSASTRSPSSSISPSSTSGSLSDINTALNSVTYDPVAHGPSPQTDQVDVTVADSFGAGETVHFIFNESGRANTVLQGTSGNNVIFATGQADTLIGGGQDQFVFKPTSGPDAVQHTVVDFNANLDTIDVRQFSAIHSVGDITTTQQGTDTLVTLDSHDTILLKNVVAATLHANDFIVHV